MSNDQTKTQAAADLTAQLSNELEELQTMQGELKNTLLLQACIVTVQNIPLKFTINGITASNPRPCKLTQATRFSAGDAEQLAEAVTNGNGRTGDAIHIKNALENHINELKTLLDWIKEANAPDAQATQAQQ
jgi:hypothetical protein